MTAPCPHADTVPVEVVAAPDHVPEVAPVIDEVGRLCLGCGTTIPKEDK